MSCDCTICFNNCTDGGCCTINYGEIESLIYDIKERVIFLTDSIVSRLKNGVGCTKNDFKNIVTLNLYSSVLEKAKKLLYYEAKNCICDDKLCNLKENVLELLKLPCYPDCRLDIVLSRENELAWIAQNPYCVSREKWEALAYHVCDGIQLEIQKDEIRCDIAFDIIKQVIPCDLLVSFQLRKEMCDLDFKINRTKEECKLDYELLIEQTNCDLEFKEYLCLIDCNLSFDMIKQVYGCGLRLEIDKNGKNPRIFTPLNSYGLNELGFKEKITQKHIDIITNLTGQDQCVNIKDLRNNLLKEYTK